MMRAQLSLASQPCRYIFQIFGLLLTLLVLEQNVEAIARALRLHPVAGTLVGAHGEMAPVERGTFQIVALEHASPLAAAGAHVGDVVVMDDPLIGMPSLSTVSPVGLTIERQGQTRHVVTLPTPMRDDVSAIRLCLSLAYLVCDMLAVFLLLGGGRRTAALELGISLAAFAAPASYVQPLLTMSGDLKWPAGVALAGVNVIAGIGFLAFAVRIDSCANSRRNRIVPIAAAVTAALTFALGIFDRTGLAALLGFSIPHWRARLLTADILPLLVTLAILIDASRRAQPEMWRRHATLFIGIGVIVLSQLVTDIGLATAHDTTYSIGLALQIGASVAGAGLMTYGVFGQRVIDVGFIVNRTLVYGLMSVMLLVGFGLLEWAINFFAPVHGRGQNAALGAVLALTVSLAFHRVHRFAEGAVERVFFRQWRDREEELRGFLKEAPFFTRPEALSNAALTAFRRFAEGTPIAIYQRGADGDFQRLVGCVDGLGPDLNADADMLVRLRARTEAVETGTDLLALPMTTRNDLNGVVVLGRRSDGAAWRPDQIEELMNAARDVGQDLQVLEIDRLQAEVVELSQQLEKPASPILSAISRIRGEGRTAT